MLSENITKYKELRKGRNISNFTSLPTSGSFRSTMRNKWQDGSVYSNINILQSSIDLRQSEKEIKKIKNHQREKRLSSLEGLHNKLLKESFNNNYRSIYLTDNTKKLVVPKIDLQKGNFSNEYPLAKINLRSNFSTISSRKNMEITLRDKTPKRTSRTQEITPVKLKGEVNKKFLYKRESNNQFLETTRCLSRTNYLIEFKKEIAVRLQEDVDNEMGEITEKIQASKENGLLLTHFMNDEFAKYMNYLFIQKENEKSELDKLIIRQHSLDLEMKKINHSISKLKINYDKYVEYRNFLVCVKERILKLPTHFMSRINEDTHNDKFNKLLERISKKSVMYSISPNKEKKNSTFKELSTKRNAAHFESNDFEIKERQVKEVKRFENYLNNPVYNNPEEFILEFDSLEKENIDLLNNYNKNNVKIFTITEEYTKILNKEQTNYTLNNTIIYSRQEKLKEVILRNKYLIQERNNTEKEIDNQFQNKNNFSSKQLNQFNCTNKNNIKITINQNFKNIMNILPENFYVVNNLVNYVEKNSDGNYIEKLKLREIEKILNLLIDKHIYYKNNKEINKKLTEYEIRIEKDRKLFKALDTMNKEEMRRNILKQIVNEKEKNFVILPKRKTTFRFKPFKKKISNNIEVKGHSKDEFNRFISYGNDDISSNL